MVDGAEEDVAADTGKEDSSCWGRGESEGFSSEVLSLESVHAGKPDDRAPC